MTKFIVYDLETYNTDGARPFRFSLYRLSNLAAEKIVIYLQPHAHNESDFPIWIILSNLPCDKRIVDIIKSGKGIISLKIFNGYVVMSEKNIEEQILHYLILRCGITPL